MQNKVFNVPFLSELNGKDSLIIKYKNGKILKGKIRDGRIVFDDGTHKLLATIQLEIANGLCTTIAI